MFLKEESLEGGRSKRFEKTCQGKRVATGNKRYCFETGNEQHFADTELACSSATMFERTRRGASRARGACCGLTAHAMGMS